MRLEHKQHGATLITALVMLVVLTLLAAAFCVKSLLIYISLTCWAA